jgi:hypothetical protein
MHGVCSVHAAGLSERGQGRRTSSTPRKPGTGGKGGPGVDVETNAGDQREERVCVPQQTT